MNKRIKVCHIITKLELGGAQQNTLYTVSHLDKERFEPVLITGRGGILDDEARSLPGVKVIFTSKLVRRVCPCTDSAGLFRLAWHLFRERPDIIHTHSSKAGILGRIAGRLTGVPVIVHTFHGFGFHDRQNFIVRWIYILVERICAAFSDKLIVVAKDNIEKALSRGIGKPGQYAVIRSGVETSRIKSLTLDKDAKRKELGIAPGETVITTIGPFKPQKNLADFVSTAAKVAEKNPKCRFLMVGDGDLRPELELQIRSLEMHNKITLLGWRRDIPEILAVTDIFVMTSLWEGLPRSILEAMCSGKPVVANSVDGVKEIVQDRKTGYLAKPFDTSGMAKLIAGLTDNAKMRNEMGAAGKAYINAEFDIDHMVRQQEDLYTTLISSARGPSRG